MQPTGVAGFMPWTLSSLVQSSSPPVSVRIAGANVSIQACPTSLINGADTVAVPPPVSVTTISVGAGIAAAGPRPQADTPPAAFNLSAAPLSTSPSAPVVEPRINLFGTGCFILWLSYAFSVSVFFEIVSMFFLMIFFFILFCFSYDGCYCVSFYFAYFGQVSNPVFRCRPLVSSVSCLRRYLLSYNPRHHHCQSKPPEPMIPFKHVRPRSSMVWRWSQHRRLCLT